MNASSLLIALLASSTLTLSNAQTGSDSCSTPDAIAGQGSFAFDSTTATTGANGQAETLCYAFGSSAIDNDVWFAWTSNATGMATISTCSAAIDTKIAAYPSVGCPTNGTATACNDDSCSLQSSISFGVGFGTTYLLQVGSFPGAAGGSGMLDVTIDTGVSNGSCVVPATIGGEGSFPFNLNGQTTGFEGQNETLCYAFGTSGIDNDIWFKWIADAAGIVTISTCSSSIDTKIALYPGTGCPSNGSALDCNDDSCGLQSSISAAVTAGTSYTLQVGNFPGAATGLGTLDIAIQTLGNDDCSSPDLIAGQGNFGYDMTLATTGLEGQNEPLCYLFGTSDVNDDIWYTWTADATGLATVSTCAGATFDTKIAAYPGTGCPIAGSSLACDDDSCSLQSEIQFNVTAGANYTLQIGTFPQEPFGGAAAFNISIQGPTGPGTGFCFCDTGNGPCNNSGATGNGCANGSTSAGANLTGSGSATVGADSLVLSATGMPDNQPGLYFQGNNTVNGGAGLVFGDGIRCAGNGVVRLGIAAADGTGASDTSGFATPISIKGAVSPGDLRHYQLWYRDPTGSICGTLFNLTNGYSVQW